jgi:predicted acylesterase/phospholipase RssA
MSVTSFCTNTGENFLFKSYALDDHTICDAAMATTAAPTYFPTYTIKRANSVDHYLDGGIWANNPVLAAINEVKKNLQSIIKKKKVKSVGSDSDISNDKDNDEESFALFTNDEIVEKTEDLENISTKPEDYIVEIISIGNFYFSQKRFQVQY